MPYYPDDVWNEAEITFLWRTVRDKTKELGIGISGVHRLRANYAQNRYLEFLAQGMDDREARRQISELLGHARIDVTYKYVPKRFETG